MLKQAVKWYANQIIGSDIEPCEVVNMITERTLEIRRMDAKLDPEWKPEMHVGGFCAHSSNQSSQQWEYASNETYSIIRIRLNVKGDWKDSNGNRYILNVKPIRFHDYNF